MSSASFETFLPAQHLKGLAYCMITLATSFTAVRLGIRIYKRRFWLIEDIIVCLAWTCCTAMTIGYICATSTVYRISAWGTGRISPYPELKDDIIFLIKIFFPNTLLLWTTLWLVKFALLLHCRRLVDRRPTYIIIWRVTVGLTAAFYIGSVITEFTSCRNLHAWFAPGECSSERDARAALISLFFSFAADIVTDLMVMIFPLRILWNLQLNLIRKISIMAIFGVGMVCIVTSTIRVAQIHSKSGLRQPSPSWLIVWAIVEASVAVVVACLPTFGLLFPAQKTSYRHSDPQSKVGHRDRMQNEGIKLRSRCAQHGFTGPVIEGNASRERLKLNEAGLAPNEVLVTTTLNVCSSPVVLEFSTRVWLTGEMQVGEEHADMDEDSSYLKSSLPEHHAGHMV
ncbi:MAG: hypothetical protein Q9182_001506 [Xanthomendoza sp. 2 TL-2023]